MVRERESGMIIYKYDIPHHGTHMGLPQGAKVLSVGIQGSSPKLWALVDPDAPEVLRPIIVLATGQQTSPVVGSMEFVGRITTSAGFEFHVFIGPES